MIQISDNSEHNKMKTAYKNILSASALFATVSTALFFLSPMSPVSTIVVMKVITALPLLMVIILLLDEALLKAFGAVSGDWRDKLIVYFIMAWSVMLIIGTSYLLIHLSLNNYGWTEIFAGAGGSTFLFIWYKFLRHHVKAMFPKGVVLAKEPEQ